MLPAISFPLNNLNHMKTHNKMTKRREEDIRTPFYLIEKNEFVYKPRKNSFDIVTKFTL